jgi:hypothetical protein
MLTEITQMPQKGRKTPRVPNIAIYLGMPDEMQHAGRCALDKLATEYGVNRSVLIQKIADGELQICKPAR